MSAYLTYTIWITAWTHFGLRRHNALSAIKEKVTSHG